jgi:hypothetical protein
MRSASMWHRASKCSLEGVSPEFVLTAPSLVLVRSTRVSNALVVISVSPVISLHVSVCIISEQCVSEMMRADEEGLQQLCP